MSDRTVYLVLGLPGAGKSSFVKVAFGESGTNYLSPLNGCLRLNTQSIAFDSLRRAFGHEYLPATEPMVNAVAFAMARAALIEGRDVLVDESITVPHIVQEFAAIAKAYNAKLHIFHLNTPVNECRARRIPLGFPEADFIRKTGEWSIYGPGILALADTVVTVAHESVSECDEPTFVVAGGAS